MAVEDLVSSQFVRRQSFGWRHLSIPFLRFSSVEQWTLWLLFTRSPNAVHLSRCTSMASVHITASSSVSMLIIIIIIAWRRVHIVIVHRRLHRSDVTPSLIRSSIISPSIFVVIPSFIWMFLLVVSVRSFDDRFSNSFCSSSIVDFACRISRINTCLRWPSCECIGNIRIVAPWKPTIILFPEFRFGCPELTFDSTPSRQHHHHNHHTHVNQILTVCSSYYLPVCFHYSLLSFVLLRSVP